MPVCDAGIICPAPFSKRVSEAKETGRGYVKLYPFREHRFCGELFAVAEDGEGDLGSDVKIFQDVLNGMIGIQFSSVHGEDDVLLADPGLGRRTAVYDGPVAFAFAHDERAIGDGQVHLFLERAIHHDIAQAEIGAANAAIFFQVIDVAFRRVYRDREADALGAGDDGDVHADHAAAAVHERAARISRVDGGVRLDEAAHLLLRGVGVGLRRDGTREPGYDAERDRVSENAERVTDGDDALAELQIARIPELEIGELLCVDLQDGDVVDGVAGQEPRRKAAPVVQDDGVFRADIVNDMLVRENESVRINDAAGAAADLHHPPFIRERVQYLEFPFAFLARPRCGRSEGIVPLGDLPLQVFQSFCDDDGNHRRHHFFYRCNDVFFLHGI